MGKTRKVLNLIALVIFLGQNFLTPFSYAFADEESIQPQQSEQRDVSESKAGDEEILSPSDSSFKKEQNDKNIEEGENTFPLSKEGGPLAVGDFSDDVEEILSPSDSPSLAGQASFKKEQNEGDTETSPLPSPNLGEGSPDEIGTGEVDSETKKDFQPAGQASVEFTPLSGVSEGQEDVDNPSVTDVTAPLERGAQEDTQNEGNKSDLLEGIPNNIQNILDKVRYFFKIAGNYKYIKYSEDDNNIGIITLKDPDNGSTITIMDRNLGAEIAGIGEDSYGYYFQWGNNHGVEEVNTGNKTTTKAEYNESYSEKGYDGKGKFIVGGKDYWEKDSHYDNLWGNDEEEILRQAACPAGYHVPTIKEWNQLIGIWGKIHTQDVESNRQGQSVSTSRYTANDNQSDIVSFEESAQECGEGDTECVTQEDFGNIISILSSELKLPLAGGYDDNGNFYEGKGIYWTATPKEEEAGVFDINAYFSENGEDELRYKSQGHSIRCFQDTEEDAQNDEQQAEPLTGTALELATARETLNSNPIEKSEKYNKVTVNVLAPAGTFPENTKLIIEAIKGDKLEEVKQQISDEPTNNIDEDAEIVAFDIRFEYKLSDGNKVELQPKENTVQVTFDYSKNKELKKADQDEKQEIEIYHINDKDENGEKVEQGEEVVEKIEINEEKSEEVDNALVIDVESFSVYTIVVQRAELASPQTWQYGEDYFTISIARPSGLSASDYPIEGFTIMDRNLGASMSGTTCNTTTYTGACGYHYQWGNNYGFAIDSDPSTTSTKLTWNSSYDNNGVVSKSFVLDDDESYDIWTNDEHHDGLWGGANDVNYKSTTGASGLYWDDGLDRTLRQGPCPEGWHVPSAGEWSMLLDYWYYTNYSAHPSVNNKLYYFSNSTKRQAFMDYFYIPFAGSRNYSTAALNGQGSYGYYWSSSPSSAGSNNALLLYLNSSNVYAYNYSRRAYGGSVRCFKDSYVVSPSTYTLTFDSNGGSAVAAQTVLVGESRTRPADPIWADHTFVDWFLTGSLTPFDFTGTLATGDLTVYAKWCGAGETPAFGLCLSYSTTTEMASIIGLH